MNKEQLKQEFTRLFEVAQRLAADLGAEVNDMLQDGITRPLEPRQAERLLTRVIEALQAKASKGNASQGFLFGKVQDLVEEAMETRRRVKAAIDAAGPMVKVQSVFLLEKHNGILRLPVVPNPVFHEREVPMFGGFIKTTDIKLWGENERLEIHVGQFRAKHGRAPSAEELLQIMLGEVPLEGLEQGDEFEVLQLARSIAANGVRKPPIIDVDGTLLDGNRRVAACYLILNDTTGEFSSQEKKRAEYIYVWQLTPHATNDDRDRVIVSLNFEDDFKKKWPEYIKARKVADEWDAMLQLEPKKPGPKQQAEMKKQLSKKYALGPDTAVVNRYLKMVRWAQEFEDHHVNFRKHDPFAVQHATNRYFQYFDELAKGEQPGGVAWSLGQDENFKRTVFDLLFDGKIENWRQIRDLKHIYASDEARDVLSKAHREPDQDRAIQLVEDSITVGNTRRPEARTLGVNTRIETFARWLEEVPPRAFRDEVRPENLKLLLRALKLVEPIVQGTLASKETGS
ncbi:hypothetical protein ACLESO_08020 [Pyxidicoccus sp. 3LG]